MEKKLTLTNCTVLTVNENDDLYEKGRIVIDGNRIVEIGSEETVELQGDVVDMQGRLVMPVKAFHCSGIFTHCLFNGLPILLSYICFFLQRYNCKTDFRTLSITNRIHFFFRKACGKNISKFTTQTACF